MSDSMSTSPPGAPELPHRTSQPDAMMDLVHERYQRSSCPPTTTDSNTSSRTNCSMNSAGMRTQSRPSTLPTLSLDMLHQPSHPPKTILNHRESVQACPANSLGELPHPNRILPFLWIGSLEHAENTADLQARRIDHILNISTFDYTRGVPRFVRPENYLKIELLDSENSNILPHLDTGVRFLKKALRTYEDTNERHGSVLVHCQAGISRSSTIVIAFLMNHRHLGWRAAYDYLKVRHSIASPNFGFSGALLQYQTMLAERGIINLKNERDYDMKSEMDIVSLAPSMRTHSGRRLEAMTLDNRDNAPYLSSMPKTRPSLLNRLIPCGKLSTDDGSQLTSISQAGSSRSLSRPKSLDVGCCGLKTPKRKKPPGSLNLNLRPPARTLPKFTNYASQNSDDLTPTNSDPLRDAITKQPGMSFPKDAAGDSREEIAQPDSNTTGNTPGFCNVGKGAKQVYNSARKKVAKMHLPLQNRYRRSGSYDGRKMTVLDNGTGRTTLVEESGNRSESRGVTLERGQNEGTLVQIDTRVEQVSHYQRRETSPNIVGQAQVMSSQDILMDRLQVTENWVKDIENPSRKTSSISLNVHNRQQHLVSHTGPTDVLQLSVSTGNINQDTTPVNSRGSHISIPAHTSEPHSQRPISPAAVHEFSETNPFREEALQATQSRQFFTGGSSYVSTSSSVAHDSGLHPSSTTLPPRTFNTYQNMYPGTVVSGQGRAPVGSPQTSSAATSTTSQGQKMDKIEHFVKSQASKVMEQGHKAHYKMTRTADAAISKFKRPQKSFDVEHDMTDTLLDTDDPTPVNALPPGDNNIFTANFAGRLSLDESTRMKQ